MDIPAATRDAAVALATAHGHRVVAIDGRSGSGKTEFAATLAARIGAGARVLHLEESYRGWSGLQAGLSASAEPIAHLLAGSPGMLPTWDWVEGRPGPVLEIAPLRTGEVLIIEGCGALAEPLGRFADVGIWCEAPVEVRKARALGRDPYDWAPLWDDWAAQEQQLTYLGEPDIIVQTG